jgi:hypothetical protein
VIYFSSLLLYVQHLCNLQILLNRLFLPFPSPPPAHSREVKLRPPESEPPVPECKLLTLRDAPCAWPFSKCLIPLYYNSFEITDHIRDFPLQPREAIGPSTRGSWSVVVRDGENVQSENVLSAWACETSLIESRSGISLNANSLATPLCFDLTVRLSYHSLSAAAWFPHRQTPVPDSNSKGQLLAFRDHYVASLQEFKTPRCPSLHLRRRPCWA